MSSKTHKAMNSLGGDYVLCFGKYKRPEHVNSANFWWENVTCKNCLKKKPKKSKDE